jgi:hypothetical protein
MDTEPWMTLEPALDNGMFVSRVVVHDQMQLLLIGRGIVNEGKNNASMRLTIATAAASCGFTLTASTNFRRA